MRTLMIVLFLLSVVACDKKQEPAKGDPAAKADPAAKSDPKTGDKPSGMLDPPASGGVAPGGSANGDDQILEPEKSVEKVAGGTPSIEELVVLMEKMAVVIEKNPKDCVKLGVQLKAFVEANKPAFAKLEAWQKKLSEEEKKAFAMQLGTRMMPIAAKMMPMMACAMDPNFAKMLEGLPMAK